MPKNILERYYSRLGKNHLSTSLIIPPERNCLLGFKRKHRRKDGDYFFSYEFYLYKVNVQTSSYSSRFDYYFEPFKLYVCCPEMSKSLSEKSCEKICWDDFTQFFENIVIGKKKLGYKLCVDPIVDVICNLIDCCINYYHFCAKCKNIEEDRRVGHIFKMASEIYSNLPSSFVLDLQDLSSEGEYQHDFLIRVLDTCQDMLCNLSETKYRIKDSSFYYGHLLDSVCSSLKVIFSEIADPFLLHLSRWDPYWWSCGLDC